MHLATQMGGEIGVRSMIEHGSTFWFTVYCEDAGASIPTRDAGIDSAALVPPGHTLGPHILTDLREVMRDQFPEVVSAFLEDVESQVRSLRQAIARSDMPTQLLAQALHSSNVGAKALTALVG